MAGATILMVAAVSCFAGNTLAQEVAALGIPLPAWAQSMLSHGGTAIAGAVGVYVFARNKIAFFIHEYENLKLVISAFIELAGVVKTEIKTPEATKAWNGVMDACAETLIDTGNKSLIQKGQFLLTRKIPVLSTAAVPSAGVVSGPSA